VLVNGISNEGVALEYEKTHTMEGTIGAFGVGKSSIDRALKKMKITLKKQWPSGSERRENVRAMKKQ
jgi:hypothetical protein